MVGCVSPDMTVSDSFLPGGFGKARLAHFPGDSEEHGCCGFLRRLFLLSHASWCHQPQGKSVPFGTQPRSRSNRAPPCQVLRKGLPETGCLVPQWTRKQLIRPQTIEV